jgi:hypothetical protein
MNILNIPKLICLTLFQLARQALVAAPIWRQCRPTKAAEDRVEGT